jgi:large subunit ribosomal protein L32
MAVQKRRQSKSRSAIRRAQVMKRTAPAGIPCAQCGEMKLPHRACAACGFYRGRQVIEGKQQEEAS